MMKWIFSGMIILSAIFGIGLGRIGAVSAAAISGCGSAVQLAITLAGSMCLWSGMMKVAQRSGLTERLSLLLAPVLRLLFEKLPAGSEAAQAVCLNISANLLGLGNAATPLGITAMRKLSELNGNSEVASNNMCMFVALNTASLQIIPTTTAMLRQNAGSAAPMEILPASLLASAASILSAIFVAKMMAGFAKSRERSRK